MKDWRRGHQGTGEDAEGVAYEPCELDTSSRESFFIPCTLICCSVKYRFGSNGRRERMTQQ